MRRWITGGMVVVFCMVFMNCGGSSNPQAVMDDFIDILEDYINSMDSAGSVDDVVKAMNTYSDKVEAMIPRMKAVQEKYPELKNMQGGTTMPKGFEAQEKRMKELMPKMMGMGAKMMQYGADPKVQEAQKKFMEVMQKMK